MTTEPTPAADPSTAITETPAAPPAASPSTAITETPSLAPPPAPTVVDAPPAPSTPAGPATWPFKMDVTILALLLILSFLLASMAISNGDLWLNLAIGKRYSEGKFDFGVDPFSWTTDGVYWVHHSWLYSWLVYGVYTLFGAAGLVIGKALVFTAAIGLLARVGWNETNRWFVLICLVMAALAASGRALMQPQVISFLFVAITLFVLERVGLFALKRVDGTPPAPDPSPPAPLPQGERGETGPAALPAGEGNFGAPGDVRLLWCLPPLFALWANLDAWFILGPILVALCWAGVGLARWFPSAVTVPGKTLGMIVGVGLLACVLNPHHVRVFQLPPELAYLLVTLTDPLGIPLPDALVAAGRTFKEISVAEPSAGFTVSSLAPRYNWNTQLGLNPAGWAAGPLLLLGLVTFTLVALIGKQAGAPMLSANRFLPWLAFAVPALALYRMIPFFALVAAPLTAMTLGEYLLWWQTTNAVPAERRARGLNLARILSVPFLLVLLGMAWPGWLHGFPAGNEWSAPRRVAWTMRPDPSMQRAAETLQALKEKNECHNAFNVSLEMGNYLPWFAPDVKYFWDTRFGLYAGKAPVYGKTRDALAETPDPGADQPAPDWQALFVKHQVDHAVLGNLLPRPGATDIPIMKWWAEADRWRERYVDIRVAVFSWAGPSKTWPANQALDDLNRQAFGDVPARDRPKARGIQLPAPPGIWVQYQDGVNGRPAEVGEAKLRFYYHRRSISLREACSKVSPLASVAPMPGGGMTWAPSFYALLDPYGLVDLGPPALPILIVRTARRAVAENPYDPSSHITLADAHDNLRRSQEEPWTRWTNQVLGPSELRARLRQFQILSGYYTAIQLQPENVEVNQRLAQLYIQMDIFDIALDHMVLARKAKEAEEIAARQDPKKIAAMLKQFDEHVFEPLTRTVKLRQAKYNTETGSMTALQKANYALKGVYIEMGRGGEMRSRLGLAKQALEVLNAIDEKALDEKGTLEFLGQRFALNFELGYIDAIENDLQNASVRKALPPDFLAHAQMMSAAALGDYEKLDKILKDTEIALEGGVQGWAKGANELRAKSVVGLMIAPGMQSGGAWPVAVALQTIPMLNYIEQAAGNRKQVQNNRLNMMTLRGSLLLEVGETSRARAVFEAALAEAGSEHFFSEHIIAQRYLELLKAQGR